MALKEVERLVALKEAERRNLGARGVELYLTLAV
jgi:hypothetical protein